MLFTQNNNSSDEAFYGITTYQISTKFSDKHNMQLILGIASMCFYNSMDESWYTLDELLTPLNRNVTPALSHIAILRSHCPLPLSNIPPKIFNGV